MSVAYKNFYFDSDEYGDPIKSYVDDKIWFKLMAERVKNKDVFVRKNMISLQDGFLQLGDDKEQEFMTIARQQDFHDLIEDDGRVMAMYWRMDPQVDTYERQVYSSGDLLAQVGGIYSFLSVIGGMLVFMFSERLMVSALAGKLYQVYDERKDKGGRGSKKPDKDASRLNNSSNKIFDSSMVGNDDESKFFTANPIRNLYKSTLYCRNKAGNVAKKLKENKELDEVDRLNIKNLVLNRKRFNYNSFHVFEYLLC